MDFKKLSEEFLEEITPQNFQYTMSGSPALTDELIDKYKEILDWDIVMKRYMFSMPTLTHYLNHKKIKYQINWSIVVMNQPLTIEFIKKHLFEIDFQKLAYNPHLTFEIIKEFISQFTENEDIAHSLLHQKKVINMMPLQFIVDYFFNCIDDAFECVLRYKDNVSFDFIKKYINIKNDKEMQYAFEYQDVPLSFVEEHVDDINMDVVFKYCKCMTEEFVEQYKWKSKLSLLRDNFHYSELFIENHQYELNWNVLCNFVPMSPEFMEKMDPHIIYVVIGETQQLSQEFIEKHKDKLLLDDVCMNNILSEDFIRQHIDDEKHTFPIEQVLIYQDLSEDFLNEILHNPKILECRANHYMRLEDLYDIISGNQPLSEKMIDTYKDKLVWRKVSVAQQLSEDFIEDHLNYVNFDYLAIGQHLSEDFIERHYESFQNKYQLIKYQELSEEFLKRHFLDKSMWTIAKYNKIENIKIPNNWLYLSTEEKKKIIEASHLFECHDTYFIAYKAVRTDGYSLFNFRYRYEEGKTYTSKCDCTDASCSFGLGAGTKEYAEIYGGPTAKIMKCKIQYEDVGRLLDDGKIRCFKLEILK